MQGVASKIKRDEQGRIICDRYRARVTAKTCILRQDRVVLRGIFGGKVIDTINDPICQRCEIGALLKAKGKGAK